MALLAIIFALLLNHLNTSSAALFQARDLSDLLIDVDVGASTTTVTAIIPSNSFVWRGIGFGGAGMKNTYAVIGQVNFGTSSLDFMEYYLGNKAIGTLLRDAAATNWNSIVNDNGVTTTITLTRDNDLGLTGQDANRYYTFNPADTTLDIIYAIGQDIAFSSSVGHTPTTRVGM